MVAYRHGRTLASLESVRRFQAAHAVSFPPEYLNVVGSQDGASLLDGFCEVFNPVSQMMEVVTCDQLIPFETSDEDGFTMEQANAGGIDGLPAGVVAFATEGTGLVFGFDYREKAATNPSVVCFNPEYEDQYAVFKVADNFGSFWNSLFSEAEYERRKPTPPGS